MNHLRLISRSAAAPLNWTRQTFRIRPFLTKSSYSTDTNSSQNDAKQTVLNASKKQKQRFQTLAIRSLGLFIVAGVMTYIYFDKEKKMAQKLKAAKEADQQMGKPKIGGPFTLLDQNGNQVSNTDYLGKFMLVYFGFTNCPDICPEELDKITQVLNELPANKSNQIQPIFISVDPARDDVSAVKEYIQDFHPRLVGLTGSYEMVKSVAKAYRVYFSSPPPSSDTKAMDYIVDHSIFMYLMDPSGQFVDAFGKNLDVNQLVQKCLTHIDTWESQQQQSK